MKKRMLGVAAVFSVAAFVFVGCNNTVTPQQSDSFYAPAPMAQSNNGIGMGAEKLMAVPGVVGVGNGKGPQGAPAVIVMTEAPGIAGIPSQVDGKNTIIRVTGKIYALGKPDPDKKPGGGKPPSEKIDPTARFNRPVPIGVSTGNEGECSAGTIGARVTDGINTYILSNNHVLALENNAAPGSKVLQPGLVDAEPLCVANPDDVIGTLADFIAITFVENTVNTIDAAIALTTTSNVGNATPSNGYGVPKSATVEAALGMKVQKYGRTTSLTRGTIDIINFTVSVQYSKGVAVFVDQIVVKAQKGAFIKAGDSGSLLVTDDSNKNSVGLLFAGDATGRYGIANHINDVLSALNVTIDGE